MRYLPWFSGLVSSVVIVVGLGNPELIPIIILGLVLFLIAVLLFAKATQ